MSKATEQRYLNAVNRLAKWRTLLTGWQLGTRPKGDPEGDAVRDHREATLILRAEMNAITFLLLDKNIITQEELQNAIAGEADHLSESLSRKFPGVTATDIGLSMNLDEMKRAGWMEGWKP